MGATDLRVATKLPSFARFKSRKCQKRTRKRPTKEQKNPTNYCFTWLRYSSASVSLSCAEKQQ